MEPIEESSIMEEKEHINIHTYRYDKYKYTYDVYKYSKYRNKILKIIKILNNKIIIIGQRITAYYTKYMDRNEVKKVGSIWYVNTLCISKESGETPVFRGWKDDGTDLAVKKIPKSQVQQYVAENYFLRLPILDNVLIVRYVDSAVDRHFYYLATNLCIHTLEEHLRKGLLTEEQKRTFVKQILSTLKALHSENIIHNNIKPQNVLIDFSYKNARLASFGKSIKLPVGHARVDTGDMKDVGMLTYYILSGGPHPFGDGGNILDDECNPEHIKDVVARDLVNGMIQKNPEDRSTAQQCLGHPFFWTTFSKGLYLREVADEEELSKYKKTDKSLLDELDQYVGEATWKKWKQKIPPKILEAKDPKGIEYHENTAGLLRFMRNLRVHPLAGAEKIDWMATFPDLFGGVYLFAQKKGWNSRDSLKELCQNLH